MRSGYFLLLMIADRLLSDSQTLPPLYWLDFGTSIVLLLLLVFLPGLPGA